MLVENLTIIVGKKLHMHVVKRFSFFKHIFFSDHIC